MECWTCRSNTGEKRISLGPTIFEGKYWLVEHAYPVKRIGWLVIVLKRHAEALHELSSEEFIELGQIHSKVMRFLFEELQCEKEYFTHIHMFAKPHVFPSELKGGKSFALLKVPADDAVHPNEIIAFCQHRPLDIFITVARAQFQRVVVFPNARTYNLKRGHVCTN